MHDPMIYEWDDYTPALPSGQLSFCWQHSERSEPLMCHVTYEADSGDGFEEPVDIAYVEVEKVYARGQDITDLLHKKFIHRIQRAALDYFEKEKSLRD